MKSTSFSTKNVNPACTGEKIWAHATAEADAPGGLLPPTGKMGCPRSTESCFRSYGDGHQNHQNRWQTVGKWLVILRIGYLSWVLTYRMKPMPYMCDWWKPSSPGCFVEIAAEYLGGRGFPGFPPYLCRNFRRWVSEIRHVTLVG